MTQLTMNRRTVLGVGIGAGVAMLAMPNVLRAQDKSLKVGVYGGYFKDSFDKNIFPEFTKATGIAVESVAEPTGEAWLVQMQQAAQAGQAPADVSMMSQVSMRKGQATELWAPLDLAKIKNSSNLLERFINKYPDGRSPASALSRGSSPWSPTPMFTRKRRPAGQRCGTRPMPTSSVCWRSSPTPSCLT